MGSKTEETQRWGKNHGAKINACNAARIIGTHILELTPVDLAPEPCKDR
jgi:hypothetical protein